MSYWYELQLCATCYSPQILSSNHQNEFKTLVPVSLDDGTWTVRICRTCAMKTTIKDLHALKSQRSRNTEPPKRITLHVTVEVDGEAVAAGGGPLDKNSQEMFNDKRSTPL